MRSVLLDDTQCYLIRIPRYPRSIVSAVLSIETCHCSRKELTRSLLHVCPKLLEDLYEFAAEYEPPITRDIVRIVLKKRIEESKCQTSAFLSLYKKVQRFGDIHFSAELRALLSCHQKYQLADSLMSDHPDYLSLRECLPTKRDSAEMEWTGDFIALAQAVASTSRAIRDDWCIKNRFVILPSGQTIAHFLLELLGKPPSGPQEWRYSLLISVLGVSKWGRSSFLEKLAGDCLVRTAHVWPRARAFVQ